MALKGFDLAVLWAIPAILSLFIYHELLSTSQPEPIIDTPKNKKEKAKPSYRKTYRIQGVPIEWDSERLELFLASRNGCYSPVVGSLALEVSGHFQTATATFGSGSYPPKELRVPGEEKGILALTLDEKFHGLTTLFNPPPENHQVDIIAISGLGGHAFGSFKERDGQHMWLRDALPGHLIDEETDLPMARIMTYGYESAVANSSSAQNLEDLATPFCISLSEIASSRRARPLILIAHSLGGLIVKQAIIILASSTEEHHQKSIRSIYGIVFFGVPHDGMDTSSLIPMVGDGPNRELVGSIDRIGSMILTMQQRNFPRALGPEGYTEIFCFYETMESATAQKDENGKWRMCGPRAILVTKPSATHCRPWEDEAQHTCAINRQHSDIVKFGLHDHAYFQTLRVLKGLAKRSLEVRARLRGENTVFFVQYHQNADYVNRSTILEEIIEKFGYGKSRLQRRPILSLCGLGGVGKTQIALAFVYWIRDNCPDVSVFWVRASNADSFRKAFLSIAEVCKIPDYEKDHPNVLELVKKWIERKRRGRWVMVIDNADDRELFFPAKSQNAGTPTETTPKPATRWSDYLPKSEYGSILITTRDKKTALDFSQNQSNSIVQVEKMNKDEARQLLWKVVGDKISPQGAEALSARLEHLPLAIAQAASYIQGNVDSIEEYLKLLEEDENLVVQLSEEFETVGRDTHIPNAVAATWIVSFNQMKQRNPLASDILSLICHFNHQDIPKSFIMEYCRKRRENLRQTTTTDLEITTALGDLKAFSFVVAGRDNTFNMHRLVRLVTRRWLTIKGTFSDFEGYALQTVSEAYPDVEFNTRRQCADYLPHAMSVLQNTETQPRDRLCLRSELLSLVAYYLIDCYRSDEAEEKVLEVVELLKNLYGEEDAKTIRVKAWLVEIYYQQDRLEEAETLAIELLDICGEEHEQTLFLMDKLACVYGAQERWEQAEDLQAQVIERCSEAYEEGDHDMITSVGNLASILKLQGKSDEAEELENALLEICRRVHGEESPHTLRASYELALTYWFQGKLQEAENLQRQVFQMMRNVLGEDAEDTLVCMGNLAHILKDMGKCSEGFLLLEECFHTRVRVSGSNHPRTVRVSRELEMWTESDENSSS